MKCQKCGRGEVSFHYSSNVNGCVTEAHLCSECAAEAGYGAVGAFRQGGLPGAFFPVLSEGLFPRVFPGVFTAVFPFFGPGAPGLPSSRQGASPSPLSGEPGCGCGAAAHEAPPEEVDAEMSRRREVNMLREQMRLAAESDDFERAIELRERIKEFTVDG